MIVFYDLLLRFSILPYLLVCADCLSDLYLASLIGKHRSSNAPAIVSTRKIVTRDFRRVACLLWIVFAHKPLLALDAVPITILLRAGDGAAVVGESLSLLPFSANSAQAYPCQTDVNGLCTWQVASGLYELLSDQPLDDLSRYAVAEGGLRGLGLTVGDNPITYTLTIQPDGFLYFDTAPDALIPVPFIPTEANTHLTFTPVATSEISAARTTVISAENTTTTADPSAIETVSTDASAAPNRVLFIIGVGIGVGIGSALLPRLRRYLQGGRDA